jgi:hypothetical protein
MRSFIFYTPPEILLGRSNLGDLGEQDTSGRGEERVQGFDGKVRRKDTTWKTKDGIRMDLREIG